jgi:serine phosphatase RsbU (regulator of sigma subunit)
MSGMMRKPLLLLLVLTLHAVTSAAQSLYWELPSLKASAGVSYSASAANDEFLALAWQERTGTGSSSALTIWVDTARLDAPNTDTRWSGRRIVHGPIPLVGAGEEPRMYSLAVDDRRILVAVVLPSETGEEGSEVLIKSSEGGEGTFREIARFRAATVVTSPDLSRTADGGWLLFLTQPEEIVSEGVQAAQGKLSIAFSTSRDGEQWSDLKPLVTEPVLTQNIQPHHVVLGTADYVVFQSKRVTNHLYLKRSGDGGRTWGPSIPITSGETFAEAAAGKARTPDEFNNQRPFLVSRGDRLGLAWERALVGSDQSQIYYCEIDPEGNVLLPKEMVTRGGGALYPQFVQVGGQVRLLYAEKQMRQTRFLPMLASRATGNGPALWDAIAVSKLDKAMLLPHGAVLKGRLYVFAETLSGTNTWELYAIRPDTSAPSPALKPLDFAPGSVANRSRIGVSWDEPADPSRIAGYRYTWGVGGAAGSAIDLEGTSQRITLDAPEDGSWTLSVWSLDRAGNVSREPARITYLRDATPPAAVTMFIQPAPLPDGYQPTNDFTVSWSPPEGDRIARYEVSAPIPVGGGNLRQQERSLVVENADDTGPNGEWIVTVSAVDMAGNVGPASSISIRLNRYQPVTRISSVETATDPAENLVLRLAGRGFMLRGAVTEVYLDRDEKAPYDITLARDAQQFVVTDDRHIQGITLSASYDSGTYFVGVRDPVPVRGVHWWPRSFEFQAPGTVKIGDFSFRWAPRWAAARSSRLHVPFVALLAATCAGLVAVLFVVSSRRIVATAREGATLKAEVVALLEGRPPLLTVEETERKVRELRRRGIGLRLKFSLLVSVLAILIVGGIAVALGRQMISHERRILAEELQNRSGLLLDSAAARAAASLRVGAAAGSTAVSAIPASVSAMPGEARYLTITGPSDPPADDPADRDYLWATNDPSWPASSFEAGRLPLNDTDLTREHAARIATDLNAAVSSELKDMLAEAERLRAESERLLRVSLATKAPADAKAYEEAEQQHAKVRSDIRARILDLAAQPSHSGSIPGFDPDRLRGEYLFYRPVAEYDADGNFTLGMVRLRISTAVIQARIAEVTLELIRTMLVISAAAVGASIIGAVLLAGITIGPVRKLAAGVAKIRDTEDQTKLEEVPVGSRDEIGTLAEAVNDMTRGLVQAAKDKAELLVGKSLQKRFLPLEEVAGEKGSTGGLKTDRIDIYGYYEGAKGVSGDYFDFQKLDDRHYAIINCDVAGKGVPAAMIMVEVATLFLGWCRDWMRAAARRGADAPAGLDALVYTINDMLEERGFKGRFAALTVAMFDTATGTLTVCAAGNNVLYVYDADRGAVLPHPLPPTPAAGVFTSELVQEKSGFPQLALPMDRGDALFLFTDGFEESTRAFRTLAGEIVPCTEPGLKDGEDHLGTHTRGQEREQFGIPRITGIVNAVFGRGTYRLERCHTARREELEFDFSGCTGTVREAVLALVCVEKVFRVYRDALTGPKHLVHLESKVDQFLREHFRQHDVVFAHRVDDGKRADTVVYSHLREDPQYDDLTLIVVRRPTGAGTGER